jgi:hypothetical protein
LTCKKLHIITKEHSPEFGEEYCPVIHDNILGTGEELLFIDEMSMNDHDISQQHGRALSGDQVDCVDNFIEGEWYSIVAPLVLDQSIAARVMQGFFDSGLFYEFAADHDVHNFQLVLPILPIVV